MNDKRIKHKQAVRNLMSAYTTIGIGGIIGAEISGIRPLPRNLDKPPIGQRNKKCVGCGHKKKKCSCRKD